MKPSHGQCYEKQDRGRSFRPAYISAKWCNVYLLKVKFRGYSSICTWTKNNRSGQQQHQWPISGIKPNFLSRRDNCIKKLEKLHVEWIGLKTNIGQETESQTEKEADCNRCKEPFWCCICRSPKVITIQDDGDYLLAQRKPGRREPGREGACRCRPNLG